MTSWVQGRVSILHSDVLTGFMPNITVSGSGCPTDKDQTIELLVDQSAELTYEPPSARWSEIDRFATSKNFEKICQIV